MLVTIHVLGIYETEVGIKNIIAKIHLSTYKVSSIAISQTIIDALEFLCYKSYFRHFRFHFRTFLFREFRQFHGNKMYFDGI